MSKISIVTINYNDKAGLQKTIESVLSQTFKDYEFIVIDGNSSDGGKELLERYRDRVTFALSEPDTGIYNAMNKGILASKGEYLLFLNSGDALLETTTLQKVADAIDGSHDIYYGNLIFFSKRNQRIEDWIFPDKLTFGFFIENSLPHQASFIRRSLFEKYGLYNENLKIASDWEFFVETICLHKVSYKHIAITVAEYDFNGISSNPQNYNLVQSEKKQTYDRHFSMIIDDYTIIRELESKRVRNLLYIKQFRTPWKLLKGFSNILLLFLPKQGKSGPEYRG